MRIYPASDILQHPQKTSKNLQHPQENLQAHFPSPPAGRRSWPLTSCKFLQRTKKNTDATILRLFCWSPNSIYLHFGFLFKKQDNLRPTICLCYLSGPLQAVWPWPTMCACSTVVLCLRFPCAHTGALPTSVVLTLVEWFQKIVDPVFSENFANSHGSNVAKVVARTSLVEANGKSHNMVVRG